MSSVLHPVGPEEPRTYWWRRLAVVAALLVLLAVVAWAVWPRSARIAGPGDTGSPTSPVTSAAGSPSSAASTGSTGSPSPTRGASPSATGSATSTPSSTGTQTPAPSGTPTAQPVTACAAKDIRVTLTGPGSVRADQLATFKLSVINGSTVTCIVDLSTTTFELKVFSGTDRIWSTDDCAAWLKAQPTHRLGVEKAYEWAIDWTGKRSKSGCKLSGGLKPGTYVATAQLAAGSAKSEPVQVVMRLR